MSVRNVDRLWMTLWVIENLVKESVHVWLEYGHVVVIRSGLICQADDFFVPELDLLLNFLNCRF